MKCDFVEEAVVNAMREWLSEYTIKVDTEQPPQADPTETALNLIQQQLLELQSQQDKICEYLEKGGLYGRDVFQTQRYFNQRNAKTSESGSGLAKKAGNKKRRRKKL